MPNIYWHLAHIMMYGFWRVGQILTHILCQWSNGIHIRPSTTLNFQSRYVELNINNKRTKDWNNIHNGFMIIILFYNFKSLKRLLAINSPGLISLYQRKKKKKKKSDGQTSACLIWENWFVRQFTHQWRYGSNQTP